MNYLIQEQLKPKNLINISQDQIDDHWNLYKGYVNQTNALNKELADIRNNGQGGTLAYADRRRSYGFEYNGMILHEFYFGNLYKNDKDLAQGSLLKAIVESWGSFEAWKADFEAAGKMRGIGWSILYADSTTKQLTNHFIAEHHLGTIASGNPILVLDVWEHAYMVDHKASGRADYITAFMQNINWDVAETRYDATLSEKAFRRF